MRYHKPVGKEVKKDSIIPGFWFDFVHGNSRNSSMIPVFDEMFDLKSWEAIGFGLIIFAIISWMFS